MPAGLIALLALGMFGRYSLTIYQVSISPIRHSQQPTEYLFFARPGLDRSDGRVEAVIE